jgi:hypothetical protein
MVTGASIFQSCPKCGHTPLPADQRLPAACPHCGLVLAKFGTLPPVSTPREDADEASWLSQIREHITAVPAKVDPISFWTRVALLAFFAVWGIRLATMDIRSGEIGGSFLHGPLLVFHEAGHVVFMAFGEFLTIAGGTLGQLIMPAILCGALLIKNRDPFGAAIGLWLIGASLLDIAPYAWDALQPQLMLLGGRTGDDGGPHDWMYLLDAFHMRQRAHGVGRSFYLLGIVTIAISLYWGGWVLWRQKKRLGDGVVLDEEAS